MKPTCQFTFLHTRCGLREGHKDGHVSVEVVYATALGAIQQLMDEEQWSPDTLDAIAEILEQAGFELRQPAAGGNE